MKKNKLKISLLNKKRIMKSRIKIKEDKERTGQINTRSGKWFGRQEKQIDDLPKEFYKYYDMVNKKQITKVEMAKLLGVGRATLYRWINLYEG